MSLKDTLSTYWVRIQEELLPWLDDTTCSPLSRHHKQLVSVLGMVRIEAFLPCWAGLPGRPPSERAILARAFVAKAVFNFPTTSLLIEMLSADKTLRRLCGWQRAGEVPSESTFSRAFAAFAASALPSRLHEALIKETHPAFRWRQPNWRNARRRIAWSGISRATARRSKRARSQRNLTGPGRSNSPNASVAALAREISGPPNRRAGSNANSA